jgi:hypothetical protein
LEGGRCGWWRESCVTMAALLQVKGVCMNSRSTYKRRANTEAW